MTHPHYKIHYDEKKKLYRANVKNLDPSSPSPQKTFYGKTEDSVQKKITAYFQAFDVSVGRTVDAVADQLFSIHNQRFAKRTRQNYAAIYENYFSPVIGKKHIKKVTPDDIMLVLKGCEEKGLSGKTIDNIGCVIRAVFRFATEQQYIRLNQDATLKCRFPKKTTVILKALSTEEQEAIFSLLQGDPYFAIYSFILMTGLRRSEALGLSWNNVNLVAKTITVKWQLARINGTYELLPPKEYAQRTIKLSEDAVTLLREIKEKQSIAASKGKWSNSKSFVFTNPSGGHLVTETVNRHFKKAADAVGIYDATLHSLRHTFATRLYELTGNPELVREYLGHKDVATTMKYYCHPAKDRNGMSFLMAATVIPGIGNSVNCHA